MKRPALPLSSSQPDTHVLGILTTLQLIALILCSAIGGVTLAAWLIPPFSTILPSGWWQMKAVSAVCALLGVLSLTLSVPMRTERSLRFSRLLAAALATISALAIAENLSGRHLGVDFMASHDRWSALAGRMSLQTAASFFLLAFVLYFLRARKGGLSHLTDVATMALAMMTLILASGYLYGAERLVGSATHRISYQSLACLLCLAFTAFNRRAEYGIYSILLGAGIGGATARLAAPAAVAIPFLLAAARDFVIHSGVAPELATAVASSIVALAAFGLVLVLAKRVSGLEHEIHELSLRDGLTGLYNRRGFYLLAEQALRLSRRSGEPFSILFIDLDNLKQINDTLGHEMGSELLKKMSSILEQNFRETDVVGRLGGDEFVVAGKATSAEIAVATYRLQQMAAITNERVDGRFTLSFSHGHVTCDHRNPQTLDAMIERADKIMYEAKRIKHAGITRNSIPTLIRSSEPAVK